MKGRVSIPCLSIAGFLGPHIAPASRTDANRLTFAFANASLGVFVSN